MTRRDERRRSLFAAAPIGLAWLGVVLLLLVTPLTLWKLPLRYLPLAFCGGSAVLAIAGAWTAIDDGRARFTRASPWIGALLLVAGAFAPLASGVAVEIVFFTDRLGILLGFVLAWFGATTVLRSGRHRRLRRSLPSLLLATLALHLAFGAWRFFVRGEPRMTGLVMQPNFFATIVTALAFPIVLPALERRQRSRAALFAGACVLVALLCSGSRAGIGIAAVVAFGFALTSARSRRLAALVVSAVVLLALALTLVPNPLRDRFERKVDISFPRTFIWERAAIVALENPGGVGLGMFRWHFAKDAWIESAPSLSHRRHDIGLAHDVVLGAAAEAGTAGAIGVMIWIGGFVALAFTGRRGRWSNATARAGFAAAAVLVLHSLVDGVAQSAVALGVLAVLLAAAESRLAPRAMRRRSPAPGIDVARRIAAVPVVFVALLPTLLAYEVGTRMRASAEALGAGDFEGAESALRAASRVIGENAPAALARASLARRRFEQDRSPATELSIERECALAASENPLDAKVFTLLGDLRRAVHFTEGRNDPYLLRAAVSAYDRALAVDPLDLETRLLRVRLLRLLGDLDSAAADLDEVLRIEPRHPLALQAYGELELERGNEDAAVDRWFAAVQAWLAIHDRLAGGEYSSIPYLQTLILGFDPKACEDRIRRLRPG